MCWRCGLESRGHILTNIREIQTCSDKALVEFCVSKKNCQRQMLLNVLSSSESLPSGACCCDVCSPSASTSEVHSIFHPIAIRRKPRQRAVRSVGKSVTTQLKDRLLAERNAIVASNIGYRMLGKKLYYQINV